jgi:hypothetical protein
LVFFKPHAFQRFIFMSLRYLSLAISSHSRRTCFLCDFSISVDLGWEALMI